MNPKEHKEIVGAIHVHSTFSDGSRTVGDILCAAHNVGLDYLITTDHMTLKARSSQGWHFDNSLLHVAGYEHNDRANKNHYLVMGSTRVFDELHTAAQYVEAVQRDRGVGFIAHPCETRDFFPDLPSYPWTDWDVTGFDGIEVWNQMSDWVENLRPFFGIARLIHPRRLLTGPPGQALRYWDTFNRERFVAGVGGVDAHAKVMRLGPFSFYIFPIKVELKGVRTHLFVPENITQSDSEDAGKMVLHALKHGHGFISNLRWGDARGSLFTYKSAQGALYGPGAHPDVLECGGVLSARLSVRRTIRVLCNGNVLSEYVGSNMEYAVTQKGVYRFEILQGRKPWIFSNPFPVGRYPL